jgi:tetratricopeptide (TPR) repeat protein
MSKLIEIWQRHAAHYMTTLRALESEYESGQFTEAAERFDTEWSQIAIARQRVFHEPGVDADHMLAFLAQATGFQLIRLRRSARELADGAEAALPFARENGPVVYADCLMQVGALALEAAEPLKARRWFTDGVNVVRANLDDIDPGEADALLAKGLKFLGATEQQLGDDATARQYYAEAAEAARRAGNEEEEGQITGNLSVLLSESGDNEAAAEGYAKAIEIARKYGDVQHLEVWTGNLANALNDLGRYAEAEDAINEALGLARQLGDRREEGRRLGVLALVLKNRGHADRALEIQLAAQKVAIEFGDVHSQGIALHNLGQIHTALNQTQLALESFELAARKLEAAQRPHLAAISTAAADHIRPHAIIPAAAAQAVAKAEAGDLVHALAELEELLNRAESSGQKDIISVVLNHIGHVLLLQEELPEARTALLRALQLAPEGSEIRLNAAGQLATVYQFAGDERSASRIHAWVVANAQEPRDDRICALSLANLASMATEEGDAERAQLLYTRSLEKLRAAGAAEAQRVAAALHKLVSHREDG